MDQQKIDWLLANGNPEIQRTLTGMMSNINCFVDQILQLNAPQQPEALTQNDRDISEDIVENPDDEQPNNKILLYQLCGSGLSPECSQSQSASASISENDMLIINRAPQQPEALTQNDRDISEDIVENPDDEQPNNQILLYQLCGSGLSPECSQSQSASASISENDMLIINRQEQHSEATTINNRDTSSNSLLLKPVDEQPNNNILLYQLCGSSSNSECSHSESQSEAASISKNATQSILPLHPDDALIINRERSMDLPVIYEEDLLDIDGSYEIYAAVSNEDDLLNIDASYVACCQLENIFDGLLENSDQNARQDTPQNQCSEEMREQNNSNENRMQLKESSNQSKEDRSISLNISEKSHKGSCDNTLMFVQTSDCPQKDKKLCCLYCHKRFSKLMRHVETVHKNESEVRKFRDLPKGSKERRIIQDILRKKGTFDWNTNPHLNKGELITSRRPNKNLKKKATDYTSCANCLGSHTKTNLRHHVYRCTKKPLKGERIITILGRAVEGRLHAIASDRLRLVVFPVLREDCIVRLIRYDWILVIYGNKLCVKYIPHYQHNMIRARLRLAGRLLYALRNIEPEVTDYSSMYTPKCYDSIIKAIRIVAGFDPIENEFKAPATAAFIVTQIKNIGLILTAEYIKKEDSELQKKTENFLTVLRSDVGISINKTVTETQSRIRREKKQNIPSTEDVKRLSRYLDRERKNSFTQLKINYTYTDWVKLSELTMASIIVFNRRRTGETQNIRINDFLGRESIDESSNSEMFATLSDEAKALARKFSRMKIRGKKGRTVPVLLKPGIDDCIELLIHYREIAGISTQNEYLFALHSYSENKIKVIDACSLFRKFSEMCGAVDPKALRGTTMRKHMASMCIGMELNDGLVAEVADFMGHHERVHREYYRHNTIYREVVKMSQILEAAQGHGDEDLSDSDNDKEPDGRSYVATDTLGRNGSTNENVDMQLEVSNDFLNIDLQPSDECESNIINAHANLKRKITSNESGGATTDEDDCIPKKFAKKRWTPEELTSVYAAFGTYFQSKTLPSAEEIMKQQKVYKGLQNRTWQQIKTWIHNQHKKRDLKKQR